MKINSDNSKCKVDDTQYFKVQIINQIKSERVRSNKKNNPNEIS